MKISHLLITSGLVFSSVVAAAGSMPMANDDMQNKQMQNQAMPQHVEDNRQIVPLTEEERIIVMAQMRQMLASVQGVTDGLSRRDLKAVIHAASQSGMAMMQGLPSQIRMKFPPAFAQMGMATHQAFDKIARQTKSVRNPRPVLKLLSGAMQSCVACHATYRFAPPK